MIYAGKYLSDLSITNGPPAVGDPVYYIDDKSHSKQLGVVKKVSETRIEIDFGTNFEPDCKSEYVRLYHGSWALAWPVRTK